MNAAIERWAPASILTGLIALTLEVLARRGLLTSYIPAPSLVFEALWRALADGSLTSQLGTTLFAWAIGFGIAVAFALIVGLLMGTIPLVHDSLSTLVDLLRPVPSVAIIPLAILFFGLGVQMRFVMIAYAAFWPMVVNTLYGVRSVDPLMLDTARNFGTTRFDTLVHVTLPASLIGIATGLRISASLALAVTVTVELVAGDSGVGYYIAQSEQANRIASMYGAIFLSGIIGWLINVIFLRLEKDFVFWSPASRRHAGHA